MNLIFQPSAPDHVPKELIVDFDFFDVPEDVSDPVDIWHGLARRGAPPIFYTPRNGGHWVFLRYADIVEGYRNHEIFSTRGAQIPPIEPFPVLQPNGVDPPEHDVFRKLLAPMFTPLAVRRMTDGLQRRAESLISGLAGHGGCDFIADYAAKFPTATFLELFGLPEERLPEFLRIANIFFRSTDPDIRAANLLEIYAVLEELFREKERNPGNDIATTVLQSRDVEGNAYPWQDIINCGFLLFVAGLDTVTNTMAYVWRYLAATPDARRKFRERLDDPAAFLLAIEELMRINAVSNIYRRVTHDCEYRGVRFRKNDRIILPNTVANRDASIFPDPQTIDLDRKVNNHVTFGVGPHRCIGSHLAKREIMISLQEWLRQIPEFELAGHDDAPSAFGGSVMGFESLKLRW
ncbi:cytochrome P450 [Sphingobium sp.]|uniref:cytochrome P450 n=1 Tax=Sphingobium sp. TaxID=1912891 RepID=UPI002C7D0432|nr:cytochrome P450 [Sphingobium sp.]HUD90345.1 cytochrome P450 [Sphingobium sp.]